MLILFFCVLTYKYLKFQFLVDVILQEVGVALSKQQVIHYNFYRFVILI